PPVASIIYDTARARAPTRERRQSEGTVTKRLSGRVPQKKPAVGRREPPPETRHRKPLGQVNSISRFGLQPAPARETRALRVRRLALMGGAGVRQSARAPLHFLAHHSQQILQALAPRAQLVQQRVIHFVRRRVRPRLFPRWLHGDPLLRFPLP